MNREAIKEYVESYGWKVEDLTEQELEKEKEEIEDQEKGMIIPDGILFFKPIMPYKE